MKKTLFISIVIVFLSLNGVKRSDAQDIEIFNFNHARESLNYFAEPNTRNLSHVAFTQAAEKLSQHLKQGSTFQTTKQILSNKPSTYQLDASKALLALIADNPDKQKKCHETSLAHLPENTELTEPVFLVWGGENISTDHGVISVENSSLIDITDKLFNTHVDAIWEQCIHALHHAGMNKLNPIPFSLDNIQLGYEILAFIEHKVLIEGSSHYAVTSNLPPMTFIVSPFESYMTLKKQLNGALMEQGFHDKELLKRAINSAKDMGSMMAREIDNKLGREALLRAYKGGAASFFQTYRSLPKAN